MSRRTILIWLPRILSFAFISFLTILSFDVFVPGVSLGEVLLASLIHNIPSIFLAFFVALAWKREWLGTVIFAAAGLLYATLQIVDGVRDYTFIWILMVSGPALAVSIAYWIAWRQRVQKM